MFGISYAHFHECSAFANQFNLQREYCVIISYFLFCTAHSCCYTRTHIIYIINIPFPFFLPFTLTDISLSCLTWGPVLFMQNSELKNFNSIQYAGKLHVLICAYIHFIFNETCQASDSGGGRWVSKWTSRIRNACNFSRALTCSSYYHI